MDNNHIHNFKITHIPATCKERGYTLHKCDCGYEHKSEFTPLGQHRYIKAEEVQPTCTENGYCKYYCEVCGECGQDIIPAKGHTWGEWQVQTIPTCTESGSQYHICQECGYREDVIIPAKGHNFKKEGKVYFCYNCGETVEKVSLSKKRKKGIITAAIISAVSIALILVLTFMLFIPMYHYSKAKNYIEKEEYKEAYHHLEKAGNYSDSEELLKGIGIIGYEKYTYQYYDADGNLNSKTVEICDKKGNDLTSVDYDAEGNATPNYEYVYDDEGNILSRVSYDSSGKKSDEKKFDKNGNVLLSAWYDDGVLYRKHEFTYDDKGNKTSETCYGDLNGKYTYENIYDEEDKLTSQIKYFDNGSIAGKNVYTYDKNGNMLSEVRYYYTSYYGDYTKSGESQYTYDEEGNKLSYVSYDSNGKKSYERKYDKNGNELLYARYEDGVLDYKYEYTYDEAGNMLSGVDYYGDELNRKYEYTYDDKGNPQSLIAYYQKDIVDKYEYEYIDDDCNVICKRYDADGNVLWTLEEFHENAIYGLKIKAKRITWF